MTTVIVYDKDGVKFTIKSRHAFPTVMYILRDMGAGYTVIDMTASNTPKCKRVDNADYIIMID